MNTRYLFEHDLFPKLFDKDPVRVINKVLTEKTDYVFGMLKEVYDKKGEICPFSLTDLTITIKSEQSFDFIIIDMPKAEINPGNCHQIILVYSFSGPDNYPPVRRTIVKLNDSVKYVEDVIKCFE